MITFVNYEKHFVTISYLQNNKSKSVNCNTGSGNKDKKVHYFRVADEVSFQLTLSDRGDKMTAHQVKFLYNPVLDLLIRKSATENRFTGYLKKINDRLFVKEWESYLFFPLLVSPWEKPPVETAGNEAISFSLLNMDKPGSLSAELFSHNYIPEYRAAFQHYENAVVVEATIYKISPHAIYVNLFNNKIQAKIKIIDGKLKEGDTLQVIITHLTNTRIVIEQVANT